MVALATTEDVIRCHACGHAVAEYTPRGIVVKRIRWAVVSWTRIWLRCGNSRRYGNGAGERGVCGAETVIVNREHRQDADVSPIR